MTSYLISIFMRLPCQEKTSGLVGKQRPVFVILKKSKMWTWPIEERERHNSQSHANDWSQEWSYLPRLLTCHAVYYSVRSSNQRAQNYKSWTKSRTGWKKRCSVQESCSYISFAFFFSKTPVTATYFSHWDWKHGDVSRRPNVRIRIIGVQIIENPLYFVSHFIANKLSTTAIMESKSFGIPCDAKGACYIATNSLLHSNKLLIKKLCYNQYCVYLSCRCHNFRLSYGCLNEIRALVTKGTPMFVCTATVTWRAINGSNWHPPWKQYMPTKVRSLRNQ